MNKMREVTERGTVSLPFGRVTDPFECGIRVFVPRKYLPRFIADFFDSYPDMNIGCAEIEERFGYFGRENPVKKRGCWFFCNGSECALKAPVLETAYVEVYLEDVWDVLSFPERPEIFPLNLSLIYS